MVTEPIYVKAVFLDAVGTLFRIRGSVGEVYWKLARPYGVRATPEMIDRAFKEVFRDASPLAFPDAQPGIVRRLERQWWYHIVGEVFRKVGGIERFEDYFESVFSFFSGSQGWELYNDTISVLEALKDRGMIIGMISNFDSRIYPVLADLGIFKFFDSVHISSREGVAKPNREIFENAIAAHGLHPNEALHVGDSPEEDVQGAREAGLNAVYLNRNGSGTDQALPSIRNLSDLLSFVHPL